MPYGVVKTKRDERLWEKAKGRVREEYPEVEEGSDRYWALVNGIYQRMRGVTKGGAGKSAWVVLFRKGTVRGHPRRKPKGGVTAIPRYTRRVQRGKTVVYEYTEEHKQQAEQAKFERVQQLAQKLPQIIQDIDRELDKPDAPRDKVIAAIVMLIDRCYFRLGTEAYARKYQTYGVSTLRVEHVEVHGDQVRFRFPGKKRVLWDRVVTDPRLARLIEELVAGSPDGHLFWYNEGGNRVLIKGQDVNKWLRRYGDITAKDFRTYHATQLAYEGLQAVSRSAREKRLSPREAKQRVAKVVKDVAEQLGHTPAVCRRSYILPALIENFMKNGGRLTYRSWRP